MSATGRISGLLLDGGPGSKNLAMSSTFLGPLLSDGDEGEDDISLFCLAASLFFCAWSWWSMAILLSSRLWVMVNDVRGVCLDILVILLPIGGLPFGPSGSSRWLESS